MNKALQNRLLKIMGGLFIFVLALMPFHTFIMTWAGSWLGSDDVLKALKDILIALTLLISLWLVSYDKKLRLTLLSSRLNRLIIAYALLTLVITLIMRPPLTAAVAGLAFNLRFFAMFWVGQHLALKLVKKELQQKAIKIALIGGLAVAAFGFLQVTVLPDDILANFGYSRDTVQPYLTVDNNDEYVRINSTLRGPNPLGAYMVIMATVAYGGWFMRRKWRNPILFGLPLGLMTLYATYSRSAALALAITVAVVIAFRVLASDRGRRYLLYAGLAGLLALPIGYQLIKDTTFYQINILHNDLSDDMETDSNTERLSSYELATQDIKDNPLGDGAGTSGPASRYGDETRLSENYYLQIGQEVGVAGLAVFIAIIALTAQNLATQRSKPMQLALLGCLIGLTVANLFLHTWADDTTAIVFWALAGLFINNNGHV